MRRARKPVPLPEVTLTPLIDVALTLLVIFMVTTPMIQNSLKIDLPEGSANEVQSTTQELIVEIKRHDKLAVNGQAVTLSGLKLAVKKLIQGTKNRTVFVQADKQAEYGDVMAVVQILKQIEGIKHVAMATKHTAT